MQLRVTSSGSPKKPRTSFGVLPGKTLESTYGLVLQVFEVRSFAKSAWDPE